MLLVYQQEIIPPLAVGIVQELLQSRSKCGWNSLKPGIVNEANIDQVEEVHLIFVSKSNELHTNQGIDFDHSQPIESIDRLGHVRIRQ